MHAIPTRYAGVQFRSRLEARWAAMFDLLGWRWEYEPIDLAGYIPDFLLRFPAPLLVEVKPALTTKEIARDTLLKIEQSGWSGEALVVGTSPDVLTLWENPVAARPDDARPGYPCVGWGMGWEPAVWIICSGVNASGRHSGVLERDHVGICAFECGSFGCRVCSVPGGSDHHIVGCEVDMTTLWREAGNRVQWRAP